MSTGISIIIVNYRSADLVIDCITSIRLFNSHPPLEIIVIDNDSNDDSRQKILSVHPSVQWIGMNYNAGYARANNEGIRHAGGETILVLNPDVIFRDNAIEECYRRLQLSDFVAGTVQLLNANGSPQISGSYFMKGGLNHLLPLPVLGRILKWLGAVFKIRKTSVFQAEGTTEVDWINGAFMMLKKEAIKKAGPFDEDFFLYAEEIEWCSRLRKIGRLAVFGDLHAVHLEGQTTNDTFHSSGKGYYDLFDKKGRQIMVSNFVRIRKQFGVGWFSFHMFCYLVEIPFFLIIAFLNTILFMKKGCRLSQFFGYVANYFYLLGKSFTIIRNKPYFYKVI
jgi:hypothetical protein